MRTITITFDHPDVSGWDVEENGRRCNGLCWGEMLEQIAMLTIPMGRVGKGYPMLTPAEWAERDARIFSKKPEQANPPLLLSAPISL